MPRLFLLLVGALLLLGLSPRLADAASSDCCPQGQQQEEEEEDCCDVDFGACCASSLAVTLPDLPGARAERVAEVPASRDLVPLHLLQPRDNGPPPTPPPIG